MKRLSASLVYLCCIASLAGCRSEPTAQGLGDIDWAAQVPVYPPMPGDPVTVDPADGHTTALLERQVTLDLNAVALGDAIASLREQTGANIAVNWFSLELVGIDPDTLVELTLQRVPAHQALRLTLEQVSADNFDDDKAGYSIVGGAVEVSTLRDLKAYTEVRIYDIRDLIYQSAAFSESLYHGHEDVEALATLLREGDGRVFHHVPEFDLNEALS